MNNALTEKSASWYSQQAEIDKNYDELRTLRWELDMILLDMRKYLYRKG